MNTNTINYLMVALAHAVHYMETGITAMHDMEDAFGARLEKDINDAEDARLWLMDQIEALKEQYDG
ncbi:MAG: hypothetical protein MZV70_29250 [Desulfobacterales bacterium]|nr:hypothetical protein [Desulfobacterales bacterium]